VRVARGGGLGEPIARGRASLCERRTPFTSFPPETDGGNRSRGRRRHAERRDRDGLQDGVLVGSVRWAVVDRGERSYHGNLRGLGRAGGVWGDGAEAWKVKRFFFVSTSFFKGVCPYIIPYPGRSLRTRRARCPAVLQSPLRVGPFFLLRSPWTPRSTHGPATFFHHLSVRHNHYFFCFWTPR
jgi:hypothetical protein